MSLLMDALKKAEEEKKRAAKQHERDTEQVAHEKKIDPPPVNTSGLSLELDSGEADISSEKSATEKTGDDSINSSSPLKNKAPALDETQKIPAVSTDLDTEDLDHDTFRGVLIEDDSDEIYQETLRGVTPETLIHDLAGGPLSPTPANAQTIFRANKNVAQKYKRYIIFSALGLMLIVSFFALYYFMFKPALFGASINTARTAIKPVTPKTDKLAADAIAANDVIAEFESAQQAGITEDTKQQIAPNALDATEKEIAAREVIAEFESAQQAGITEDTKQQIAPNALDATEKEHSQSTGNVIVFQSLEPESLYPGASEIFIDAQKSEEQADTDALLKKAFKDYQNGDIAVAASLYQSVLQDNPDSRDAHAGLAAVAINRGDYTKAYQHYTYLLALNPEDALAFNGLVTIGDSVDLDYDSNVIKTLIQREGELPYLYFSLGNIYAKQNRWTQAQQAFFNAYRLDANNPDYAANLAISLDHLGQSKSALEFYKKALVLASTSTAQFDTDAVVHRISALSYSVND